MKKIILIFLLPLLANGQSKFLLECKSTLLEKSEQLAYTQLGITELTNSNDGPEIEKYQKLLGLPPRSAYCAAGQYWCFYVACKDLGIGTEGIPLPHSGRANAVFDKAKTNGLKSRYIAQRYDMLIWKSALSYNGHIERIVECGKAGWVKTIAFNTSSGSKQGVFLKKRNIYFPLARLKVRGIVGFTAITN